MSKKRTTLAKASTSKKAVKTINNKKGIKKMTKPDFMGKFKMTPNMVIGNREAKIWVHGSIGALPAKPEIKAAEAIKAIKEVKAVPSKIVNGKTQPAIKAVTGIKAVKAVKAQAAVPAIPVMGKGVAIGNTPEIVNELIARLGDQGFYPENAGKQRSIDEVKFCAEYIMEDIKGFRAALKLCKSSGKYNDSGLKILAEKEKANKKAAKAEAKAAKKEQAESVNGKDQKGKVAKAKEKKDEGADWPTS